MAILRAPDERMVWRRTPCAGSSRDGPIEIAIVSGNIHDHAVWTAIVRGWCREIDRSRFRLSIVYTDYVTDAETEIARASVDRFVEGPRALNGWVDAVTDLHADVLIYPEVGMDRTCIKLASLRLAPVQVAAWGHPETTGIPTIDYFLSADAFESATAEDNPRERLIRLPGIGAGYASLNPPKIDVDWRELDLDPDRPIAFCPASAYKFLPEHDWTFAAIVRGAPACQIVLVTDEIAPRLSDLIARRLRATFDHAELDYDRHVRFIDHQSRPRYFALMRKSSIYLDTIGFSGFNTAMQAFECGLPVMTVEGRFLRHRFASGLLREMGIEELISTDAKAFVDNAVRLLTSPALLAAARSKISSATLRSSIGAIRFARSRPSSSRSPWHGPGGTSPGSIGFAGGNSSAGAAEPADATLAGVKSRRIRPFRKWAIPWRAIR